MQVRGYFIENIILCNLYDDEVMELFYIYLKKDLNGMAQSVSVKKRLLVRFEYVCEKYLTSNKPTIVTVEKIPVTK